MLLITNVVQQRTEGGRAEVVAGYPSVGGGRDTSLGQALADLLMRKRWSETKSWMFSQPRMNIPVCQLEIKKG